MRKPTIYDAEFWDGMAPVFLAHLDNTSEFFVNYLRKAWWRAGDISALDLAELSKANSRSDPLSSDPEFHSRKASHHFLQAVQATRDSECRYHFLRYAWCIVYSLHLQEQLRLSDLPHYGHESGGANVQPS